MDSSLALHCGRAPLTVLALSIGLALSHAAHAQQTPEAAAADAVDLDKVEEIGRASCRERV